MGRRKRCGRCSSQLLLSEGCHRTLVKQHVHATILGVRGWSPSREGMLMDRLTGPDWTSQMGDMLRTTCGVSCTGAWPRR